MGKRVSPKTPARRERRGKLVIGTGLVIGGLAFSVGAGVVGVVLGLAVTAIGGVMWAVGVVASGH